MNVNEPTSDTKYAIIVTIVMVNYSNVFNNICYKCQQHCAFRNVRVQCLMQTGTND